MALGRTEGARAPRWRVLAAWVLVLVLAGYLLALLAQGEWRLRSLDRETATMMGRLGWLYQRNAELREQLRRVRSPEYVEEKARGELGMIRRGEIPFSPPAGVGR